MILIYCKSISNRITYASEIIFKTILLAEVKITSDEKEFKAHTGPKITYGNNISLEADIRIEAVELLFENTIVKQSIEVVEYNDYKVLFPTSGGTLPFDALAMAFYLVSRYEEYLPSALDNHKRYKPESGIAFQRNFLKQPVVNFVARDIKAIILEKHPDYFFKPIPYKFVPTIDIDNAFAYKNKGIARTSFSLMRLFFKFQFKKLYKRLQVHLGIKDDPFDTYAKQISIHDQLQVRARYFFLMGDYNTFDKNVSYANKNFVSIIKKMNEKYDIGIHPSHSANYDEKTVTKELSRLEAIVNAKVTASRQHYLRLKFPDTYRNLIKCGIKEDFTMGYSNQLGFRASICTPFPFYDLKAEQQGDLLIHPFVAMDSAFKYFLKIRASEVPYHVKPLYETIKKLGGEMVVIFHNESMGNHKIWKNWENTYENIIRMCVK